MHLPGQQFPPGSSSTFASNPASNGLKFHLPSSVAAANIGMRGLGGGGAVKYDTKIGHRRNNTTDGAPLTAAPGGVSEGGSSVLNGSSNSNDNNNNNNNNNSGRSSGISDPEYHKSSKGASMTDDYLEMDKKSSNRGKYRCGRCGQPKVGGKEIRQTGRKDW